MENLLFIGRYRVEDRGISFSWPGFTVKGCFSGKFLDMNIETAEKCYFFIVVNQEERRVEVTPGNNSYRLASMEREAEYQFSISLSHEVRSKIRLKSIDTDGVLKPLDMENRLRIEFIGDSLTVGYGNLSPGKEWDRTDSYAYYTENRKGYAQLTASKLNAEAMITAFSGKGLITNYNNAQPGVTVPYFYDSIYPIKKSAKWDHNKFLPHITVINLGTNDFSVDTDTEDFKRAYLELINRIREKYKDTEIVLISPNGIALDSIEQTANESGVHFYSYHVPYSSLDEHPNCDEHSIIADGLIDVISSLGVVI